MNLDLEQAIRFALEPLSSQGGWSICPVCGAVVGKGVDPEHECRPVELPGETMFDGKRRARSYTIA